MKPVTLLAPAVICLVAACGGAGPMANPCATPDATYFEHCEEESGTCGAVPDQVINIGPDGTLVTTVECASKTTNGCIVRGSECVVESMGATTTSTFETTFVPDGSSAKSIITLSITFGAQSCVSTYACTLTRQ